MLNHFDVFNELKQLNEETDLHRGIFWIKDINDIEKSNLYFTINCNSDGTNITNPEEYSASKDGLSYNHKNTWSKLTSKDTDNKTFDYYPRGRVEIRNKVATIYCSPYIYGDDLKKWCIDKFNLTSINGIKNVKIIADNSSHYNCYLDKNS